MKDYFKSDQEKGDFATPFGDMVFGLLFFFFILAIAMIFQRSDMSDFHKEIDKLLEKITQREKTISILQKKQKQMEQMLKRLQQNQTNDTGKLDQLQKQKQKLQKMYEEARLALLRIQNKYDDLSSDFDSLSKKKYENQKARRQIEYLEAEVLEIEQDADELEEEVSTYMDHMDQIKDILKEEGLTDILAEVEQMEQGEDEDAETLEKDQAGEDKPLNVYKLWVKLYNESVLDAKLLQGDTLLSSANGISPDEAISMAKGVVERFKAEAGSYSEEDRKKNRPKMFLMPNPEIQYGSLQAFLAKARKVIPVAISQWKE